MAGKVHRLGHGVVGVFLEGGLHAHMPDGGHVVGADKHLLYLIGNPVHMSQGAMFRNLTHERVVTEPQFGQPVF